MKKLILIILLICSTISFGQVVRYVNKNATGGVYNGLSWNTGWRAFADVNWGALTPGSTLYVSGGTDSVVYTAGVNIGASGSWNNYNYLLPGKLSPSPSGHSGRVIIENSGGIGVYFNSRHWWYVKGIEVRNTSSDGIKFHYTSRHIVIDSCDVWRAGGFGIYGNGASCGGGQSYNMDSWDSTDVVYDITVKNSFIHSFRDEWPSTDDMIQFTCARDIKIYDNLILNNNLQTERGTQEHIHQDDIQTFCTQGLKIYNNILVIDSAAMGHNIIVDVQSRNGSEYSGIDENIIYNNLIYHGGHLENDGCPGCPYTQHLYLRWYGSTADMAPTYIFHNSFVWAGGSGPAIEMQRKGMFKNNIMYHDGTWGRDPDDFGGTYLGFWSSGGDYYADYTTQVDSQKNNLMWFKWTTNNDVDFGTYLPNWVGAGGTPSTGSPEDWAGWTSVNWGGNGVNANPLFADTLWSDGTASSFELTSNSPAINAGGQSTWIQAFLEARDLPITDFYGHTRTGVWDIGAIEYGTAGWTPPDTTATVTINSISNANLGSYHIGSGVLNTDEPDSTFHIWTATADSFRVTGGSFNTTMVSAENGNTLYIPVIASNQYSTSVTKYVVVSGTTRSFTVTTKADPGGGGTVNGGWVSGSNGRKIYLNNGHALITKQP